MTKFIYAAELKKVYSVYGHFYTTIKKGIHLKLCLGSINAM